MVTVEHASANVPFSLFPFEKHYFDRGGGVRMHYLDEGHGEPVVMVHGNPSWSFYYRDLARALTRPGASGEAPKFRAIVPDHVGCGLSDKPSDALYDYTLDERIRDLEALLEHLGVRENITLVLHDWGGMIGMGYAVRHPERVKRLVLLNTAAFPLPKTKSFPLPLYLTRSTRAGAFLVERFNAFSRVAARVGVTRAPMPEAVRRAYVAPYEAPGDRLATLRFVQDIPLREGDRSWATVNDVASKLRLFAGKPVLLCWGGRDFVFDRHFLAEWRAIYPHAHVRELPDAGHYVLEDASREVIDEITRFLGQGASVGANAGASAATHATASAAASDEARA